MYIVRITGNNPNNKEKLISLPGVGNYISNAVLCFAFNQRVPIVDTNIIRIYLRVFNIETNKTRPRSDKKIWDFAKNMLPAEKYVEYNYALLDFAIKTCKAKKPLCDNCIMNKICNYYLQVKRDES